MAYLVRQPSIYERKDLAEDPVGHVPQITTAFGGIYLCLLM